MDDDRELKRRRAQELLQGPLRQLLEEALWEILENHEARLTRLETGVFPTFEQITKPQGRSAKLGQPPTNPHFRAASTMLSKKKRPTT